ncbi:MAG: hypothetical protein J6O71_01080, partial [Lachnospiraceae bacterium]|nr:hypothetical protein [Lachnospiraceae bacterium]
MIGISLPVLSGFFLLWEFRDVGSVVGSFDKNKEAQSMLMKFLSELYQDIEYLMGSYTILPMCLIVVATMIYLCVKSRDNWGPTFIFTASVLWQVWIDTFIYGCSYQIATWLYLFFWYVAVCFEHLPSFVKDKSEAKGIGDSLLTAFFAVIVLTGVWGSFGQETLKDLYMPYTAAKAAAETIEALPDGAVI